MKLHVIILAAGKGTRMKSALPKVLAPLAGKPLLAHVVQTAKELNAASINVVIGHGAEHVRTAFANENINWCEQKEQKGTGHAVKQGLPDLPDEDVALILYGDVPLITAASLQNLLQELDSHQLAILTAIFDNPTGYGRILRNENNHVIGIVEQKDATPDQQAIQEINTGILAGRAPLSTIGCTTIFGTRINHYRSNAI